MPSTTKFRPIGANAPSILQNKKGIANNARKITVLKNIEKAKKDPIGDKLPGGGSLKGILGSIASSMDGIRDTLIAMPFLLLLTIRANFPVLLSFPNKLVADIFVSVVLGISFLLFTFHLFFFQVLLKKTNVDVSFPRHHIFNLC